MGVVANNRVCAGQLFWVRGGGLGKHGPGKHLRSYFA